MDHVGPTLLSANAGAVAYECGVNTPRPLRVFGPSLTELQAERFPIPVLAPAVFERAKVLVPRSLGISLGTT